MLFLIGCVLLVLVFVFLVWTELVGSGWQPVPRASLKRMLELSGAKKGKLLFDLGAGDCRIVVSAARDFGAKAVGIEIDPLRALWCWLMIKKNNLGGRARIVFGNLFKVSLHDADIVTIYLRDWSTQKLKKKLLGELKKGTRIATYYWNFKNWKPIARDKKLKVWVYEIGKIKQ